MTDSPVGGLACGWGLDSGSGNCLSVVTSPPSCSPLQFQVKHKLILLFIVKVMLIVWWFTIAVPYVKIPLKVGVCVK